jgi:rfaE bifunctional protein nucleotidyltransferase chain/domain
MAQNKIKYISELSVILRQCRKEERKVVLCHGIFDLLHIGHIRHFEQARAMGDLLVVTITPDEFVKEGIERPVFSEQLRAEAVASLATVDFVAVNEWPTAVETLALLRPDVYVKGAGVKKNSPGQLVDLEREKQMILKLGGGIAFTDDSVFDSSRGINNFLQSWPNHIQQYFTVFKSRYCVEDVLDFLKELQSLSVLVIGDSIIDDYHYCSTLGLSSKDPAIALQYQSNDLFAGGVLAVANHLANFTENVRLFSILGDHHSYKDFIYSKLHDNVSHCFTIQENAPTIVKKRYIEGYSLNKMFEVYVMDDSGLCSRKEKLFLEKLKSEVGHYDLVVAADFGHGAISPSTRELLMDKASFLAVNTQANAGNRGFHTASQYTDADYVCIAEHELRLEARNRKEELRPLVIEVAKQLRCKRLTVTRGKRGCAVYDERDGYIEVPALANNIVDRVGAGDALLSITSLLACVGAPSEIIGFIGNVVGGLAVEIMGNKKSIDLTSVKKTITEIMASA